MRDQRKREKYQRNKSIQAKASRKSLVNGNINGVFISP